MYKLTWDDTGKRFFETGVDRGVLYPMDTEGGYSKGVAWNGLTAVTESPSGADPTDLYADNIIYLTLRAAERFGATVEAYTYPDEFGQCDGSAALAEGVTIGQQPRKPFGLCYRTLLGNDIEGQDYGYKLHLVYGATASPSEKAYNSVNESPEAVTFSWEMTTTPVTVPGFKPTAHLEIDSTKLDADTLAAIEEVLYGNETQEARLPLPEEVIAMLAGQVVIVVSVQPENGASTLFGKAVSDLQTNVVVGDGTITGTLKYVTGYTGFSSVPAEQKGNYLALKVNASPADSKTTVELVGGTKGPVTLDADKNIVLLVRNKDTQSVRVVTTAKDETVTKMYSLTGLTLEAE